MIYEQYLSKEKMPDGFDHSTEEIRFIDSEKDRKLYQSAIKLIKDEKPNEARPILTNLMARYKNTFFWACTVLRLSDAVLQKEENAEDIDLGSKLVNDVVDSEIYSPVLFEGFEKWRAREQFMNYGSSNTSEIPNKEYNRKRWKLVKVIKKYLITHPGDRWATAQIDLLLAMPNIGRSGDYGNDNLGSLKNLTQHLRTF